MIDKGLHIAGILHINTLDVLGRIISSTEEKNMIVTSGYHACARVLGGDIGAVITKIGIGTNENAASELDTDLTGKALFDISNIEYPANGIVRFHFNIGYADGNGINILEFGLFTVDGTLFSRRVRSAVIEKSEYISLSGYWDVIIRNDNEHVEFSDDFNDDFN